MSPNVNPLVLPTSALLLLTLLQGAEVAGMDRKPSLPVLGESGPTSRPATKPHPEPAASRPSKPLLPSQRPRRETLSTRENHKKARLFPDKWLLKMGLERIPAGSYLARFESVLKPQELVAGARFGIRLDSDESFSFGPIQEGSPFLRGAWCEAEILSVRRPNPEDPKDRGGALFRIMYFVAPHFNGEPDLEMALPIRAVILHPAAPDRRLDDREERASGDKLWSSIGMVAAGVEGYFLGSAAHELISRLGDKMLGNDRSHWCHFLGQVQEDTPCVVRIERDVIF